jgi:integrase
LKLKKAGLSREKYLSDAEITQLKDATRQRARGGRLCWVRNWMLIDLGINTGLRIGELCGLQFGDLLPQGLSVRRSKKPTPQVDILPVVSSLRDHIYEYRLWCAEHGYGASPTDPILIGFRTKGKRLTTRGGTDAFKSCLRNAGVWEGYGTHSMRHSMGMRLLRHTGNIHMVQQQLGHNLLVSTQAYLHTTFDDRLDALQSLSSK